MLTKITICVCLINVVFCGPDINIGKRSEQINFVATHEWQPVRPDHILPKGLHIRSNLQSGLTEAKLMDFDEPKINNKNGLTLVNSDINEDKSMKEIEFIEQSKDEIKNAAKGHRFRPYEELKKDFIKMNMAVKTDIELIDTFVAELKNVSTDDTRKALILEDLGYLLHQVDNALDFAKKYGFGLLKQEMLNKNVKVSRVAVSALIAAIQGNPKNKIKAIEEGIFIELIRLLSDSRVDKTLRLRHINALGTIIRHFPLAQEQFFVQNSGLKLLESLLDFSGANVDYRIIEKIYTLLYDILTERNESHNSTDLAENIREMRLKQYAKVPLEASLVERNWCLRLVDSLTDSNMALTSSSKEEEEATNKTTSGSSRGVDHGYRENVLRFGVQMSILCPSELSNAKTRIAPILSDLMVGYAKLSAHESLEGEDGEEGGEGYFRELLKLVYKLNDDILMNRNNATLTGTSLHTEL